MNPSFAKKRATPKGKERRKMSHQRSAHEHTRDPKKEREFLALHAQLLAMNTAFEAVRAGETGIEMALDAEALRRLARNALNRSKSPGHAEGAVSIEVPATRKKKA
jgi:hypothetical protein